MTRSTAPRRPAPTTVHRAVCVTLLCWATLAQGQTNASVTTLPEVVVHGDALNAADAQAITQRPGRQRIDRRIGNTDAATLLEGIPGASAYGAGGLSSLPVLNGLADERLRVQVDGMDLLAACPNHMNSPLSYMPSSEVHEITVHKGVTPVSVGGDSLGGTIQVKRAPPDFATAEEGLKHQGSVGGFARDNGHARGAHWRASVATERFWMQLAGDTARADNFTAADGFKPAQAGTEGGRLIPADEVASSAYRVSNHDLGMAWQHQQHLLRLNVGQQNIGFEGYPNQRMDMTDNVNTTVNLRYQGEFEWGELHARAHTQRTRHAMDMGPDRYSYGTGMPMLTRADHRGAELQATWRVNDDHTLRAGSEFLNQNLYDWWPAVGGTMGPNDFWNIDNGRRHRVGAFIEWDHRLAPRWTTQLGLRHDRVLNEAGVVQGYDNGLGMWGEDAAAFNARERRRVTHHWDWTALATWAASDQQQWRWGLARKTRSPSLYQLYPWSTNAMAALMNNFVGDGNGYIGNPTLRPEVAHTASVTGRWQGLEARDWQVEATAFITDVKDFIDAERCQVSAQCSADNLTRRDGFVLLQYANADARLQGVNLGGQLRLPTGAGSGVWRIKGQLDVLHGRNRSTGDRLYNIMPTQLGLGLSWERAGWTHALQWQAVKAKQRVSAVRNEIPTAGYALLHLASSFKLKHGQIDLRVDNLFDRFYTPPLGGAYVGQGPSMTTNGIPWGTTVPGMGRAITLAFSVTY